MTVSEYTKSLVKEFRERLRDWDITKFTDGLKGKLGDEEFTDCMSWIIKNLTKCEGLLFDLGLAELECRRLLSDCREKNNADAAKSINEALILLKDIKQIVVSRKEYMETTATLLRSIRSNKPRV